MTPRITALPWERNGRELVTTNGVIARFPVPQESRRMSSLSTELITTIAAVESALQAETKAQEGQG